jgi:ElaB/YqjD/DUF883 family membrane-anchored ribosome-binding protein
MSTQQARTAKQAIKRVSDATEAVMTRVTDAVPDRKELQRLGSRAADHLASAGERGLAKGRKGLRSAAILVREHPRAAAGALLGAGILVGAVVHRAFHREASWRELLVRSLGLRLEQLNRAAQLGLQRAGSPLRKALR